MDVQRKHLTSADIMPSACKNCGEPRWALHFPYGEAVGPWGPRIIVVVCGCDDASK